MYAGNRQTRRDRSGRAWTYHAPSLGGFPGRYPHQWFWDSCAHALALRHIDIGLARNELLSLAAAQAASGLIPHQILNTERMDPFDRLVVRIHRTSAHSSYVQPPMIALATLAVHETGPDRAFLSGMLPGIKRFHRYLRDTRERGGDGLLEIVHSYESGKDRSREYDSVYGRRLGLGWRTLPLGMLMVRHRLLGWDIERIFKSNTFRVKDLLFNCLNAFDLSALSRLCRAAGESAEEHYYARQATRVEGAVLAKMWDAASGLFCSLDSRHDADRLIAVSTFSTFLPLLFDSIEKERVDALVERHLADPSAYWLRYPVPAEPLGSPEATWRKTGLWRGLQVWVLLNWFILNGLLKQAERFPERRERYRSLAMHLIEQSYELARRSGLREYYHAQTGQGQRALNFGMSGLVLDMVLMMKGPP